MPELIDIHRPNTMAIRVKYGHHLKVGVCVCYYVVGTDFQVIIHRDGIEVSGRFPLVAAEGIVALKTVLDSAVLHLDHLRRTPIGEKQVPLTEPEIAERLMQMGHSKIQLTLQ